MMRFSRSSAPSLKGINLDHFAYEARLSPAHQLLVTVEHSFDSLPYRQTNVHNAKHSPVTAVFGVWVMRPALSTLRLSYSEK